MAQLFAPDCRPLLLPDGHKDYVMAILAPCGHWVQPERRQVTGPAPKPRGMPQPQRLYAQGIQVTRRRRLVRVQHRAVFGALAAIAQVLAACGWQINTACIARVNLSIRHQVAAVGRRVRTLGQGEDGLRQQRAVYHAY